MKEFSKFSAKPDNDIQGYGNQHHKIKPNLSIASDFITKWLRDKEHFQDKKDRIGLSPNRIVLLHYYN